MAGEAGGEVKPRNAVDRRNDRHGVGRGIDVARPAFGHPGIPERPPDPDGWPAFLTAAAERRFDLAVQCYGNTAAANTVTAAVGARLVGGFAPTEWRPSRNPDLHLPYPVRLHEVERRAYLTMLLEKQGAI